MGWRRYTAMAATTVAVVAATLAPAEAAMAVSCGIVCDGVDPNQARYENADGAMVRCGGFKTIYRKDLGLGGVIELRYSTQCRMAWGRGPSGVGFSIEGWNSTGTAMRVRYPKPEMGTYTPAVNDAGLKARVCLFDPPNACTDMW
ncbi:DUF2690 domain-containing protein [Actinoplanes aureus]|uniref:DUF2690 domain-containing protein n=1 Tax=Actinoplanes aureus TaxID=2792083 RepID=A0A931CG11_9ACTN|nr:DUF2690 domain-containing protein [Actinoplanes aureus]MBG0566573.1 DUF2690 domain-containing protein [Actinoplanes aureus]